MSTALDLPLAAKGEDVHRTAGKAAKKEHDQQDATHQWEVDTFRGHDVMKTKSYYYTYFFSTLQLMRGISSFEARARTINGVCEHLADSVTASHRSGPTPLRRGKTAGSTWGWCTLHSNSRTAIHHRSTDRNTQAGRSFLPTRRVSSGRRRAAPRPGTTYRRLSPLRCN